MANGYPDSHSLWDLSNVSNFANVADDEFMAMIQKQFPLPGSDAAHHIQNLAAGFQGGVNPQNISRYSLPSLTPSSEDSSPSPPQNSSSHHDFNEDGTGGGDSSSAAYAGESALKRKASDIEMQGEGPNQKNQHTLSNDKKGTTSSSSSRRKSGGGSGKDENRLLKRKEQNRAAQRAFRERKEKHVKDLEDKVAELEAKHEATQQENVNLRDLLSRLQSENVMLKQANFTFSVPAKSQTEQSFATQNHFSPDNSLYNATSPPQAPVSSYSSPKPTNLVDWTSLATFDPNVLQLLDENPNPQPTATTSAMNLDLFADNTNANSNVNTSLPFTMIASNPMFMSFTSNFDNAPGTGDNNAGLSNGNGTDNNGQLFGFDLNAMSTWPSPTPPSQDATSLDDLFAGFLNGNNNHQDFSSQFGGPGPSISPVNHHNNINHNNLDNSFHAFMPTPPSASPSVHSSTSSDHTLLTPKESNFVSASVTPESDHQKRNDNGREGIEVHDYTTCPKTKADVIQRIAEGGTSPFAPPVLQKSSDQVLGTVISCAGSNFPRTEKSDKNVEVLSAWRSITNNPAFKDSNLDINQLCSEFTSKAKCDGQKVVLEPGEVHKIIEILAAKQQ